MMRVRGQLGALSGGHEPSAALVVQAAASAEVEVVAFELGVEVPVEVPVGEDAGLCVAEHPTTATITALVIAAATVTPGRDRLVKGGCLSLAPRTLTIRYVTVRWSCPICSGGHWLRPCHWAPHVASRPGRSHRVYHFGDLPVLISWR